MKRVLIFFRIVDAHDGLISLTNVALIVVIGKLCFVRVASVIDLGTLLIALANYNAKKVLAGNREPAAEEIPPLPEMKVAA